MRLIKIKVAGFKSFADPTAVGFPSNLTGVVGPNGCGKSNIIDAVRWVMGELSAKHLRGDSMTDVIFNGSASRKPVGTASVELVFDNSDGKISGPYADYAEVALKRQVTRDGTSNYFLNGARCRRKDITQLFLGTGLGSRSYAIIEQGMISRVIEAKADDMRAFVEEAAGISRYKERRKETEARISDTRENLERLQDVRDEVDKQIRHLQRQAATARRYQALKETERRLTAELLALRLREIDSGAEVQDSAVRECELTMQQALADQRAAEAAIETQRVYQTEQSDRVSAVQARYYEVGADISRTEQNIQHTRELREQQRNELAQARATLAELESHIQRDERQIAELRAEIEKLGPELAQAQAAEGTLNEGLNAAEAALSGWQQRWEDFNREQGAAHQTTQVERARIEQLENQLRRLSAQSDRLAIEREALMAQESSALLGQLTEKESLARGSADELSRALTAALDRSQQLRAAQFEAESRLEAARTERERSRAEVVSLEALQKAALGRGDSRTSEWLNGTGLPASRGSLRSLACVAAGSAPSKRRSATISRRCASMSSTRWPTCCRRCRWGDSRCCRSGQHMEADGAAGMLSGVVSGPAAIVRLLSRVRLAESLPDALKLRRELAHDESVITRTGEWIGRDWLRVNRGGDPHSGVLEREQRLKQLRSELARSEENVRDTEARLAACREDLALAERERDLAQSRIQGAHRDHADLLGQLEGERARAQESTVRRERLEEEAAEVMREVGTRAGCVGARPRRARSRTGGARRARFAARGTGSRTRRLSRGSAAGARALAGGAAREPRPADPDRITPLQRELDGRWPEAHGRSAAADPGAPRRTGSHAGERRSADPRARSDASRISSHAASKWRANSPPNDAPWRKRMAPCVRSTKSVSTPRSRVNTARAGVEQARMLAQESRVRREGLIEQFAATRFDLAEILAGLAADAAVAAWEESLNTARADLEKLGQVNLAAIDELKESSERKDYLDRQFADVTSALTTLEEAMRKIDKETRTRFEDTFNRINAGLKDKFPKLFGGGHAYLELVGDDVLEAGVAVMARPPGKRNSSIHQLSGGEKALTAVALVFSIFDLNPAPFCLLDEVDAPLDEHNVGRFCDIVRQMSERVQFIFITHNKATMELASQLLGVTMHEPGCSRLVSVDVDEAVRMATA